MPITGHFLSTKSPHPLPQPNLPVLIDLTKVLVNFQMLNFIFPEHFKTHQEVLWFKVLTKEHETLWPDF